MGRNSQKLMLKLRTEIKAQKKVGALRLVRKPSTNIIIDEYFDAKNWQMDILVQEEQILRELAQKYPPKSIDWIAIAKELNLKFKNKFRSCKQCRQKYVNRIKYPTCKNDPNSNWTRDELLKFLQKYDELGSKWTSIQQFFPHRAENTLKNKFYNELRKAIKKINTIGRQNIKSFSKDIKYESFMRILKGSQGTLEFKGQLQAQCLILKSKLIQVLKGSLTQMVIVDLINEIHEFNMNTRCYTTKKNSRKNRGSEFKQESQKISDSSKPNQDITLQKQQVNRTDQSLHDAEKLFKNCIFDPAIYQLDKVKRKNHFNDISDLDAEVSYILGQSYRNIGFSYLHDHFLH